MFKNRMRTDLFDRWTKNARLGKTSAESGEAVIQVSQSNLQSIVIVSGCVTVDSSPHVRSVLLSLLRKGACKTLTIDLSKVYYADVSGIATFLEAVKAAGERSTRLRLVGLTGQVRMLAEVTKLDEIYRAVGAEVEFK